jgi:CHAT domain-containing protein
MAPSLYAIDMVLDATASYAGSHVVFGDPDGSLPGARAEAKEVAAVLKPDLVELRVGEHATYEELLSYASDARFVHLATHGKLDHHSPRNSFLLLAENRRMSIPQIMTLPLASTDLVFLSACETSVGADGLEYRTIAHAFAHAGVPSVIATLWKINDKATRKLALAFYDSRMAGNSNAAALAAAQKAMIEAEDANRLPGMWAGFTIFGKP